MSEEEKVQILKEQLARVRQDETESDTLKFLIRQLGFSPDKRTW